MGMDIEELIEYERAIDAMIKKSDEMVERIAEKYAAGYIRAAKKATPVDTGNLRRSWDVDDISHNGDRTDITIINAAEYAEYVDKGHRAGKSGWVEGKFMTTKAAEACDRNGARWARPIIKEWLGGAK